MMKNEEYVLGESEVFNEDDVRSIAGNFYNALNIGGVVGELLSNKMFISFLDEFCFFGRELNYNGDPTGLHQVFLKNNSPDAINAWFRKTLDKIKKEHIKELRDQIDAVILNSKEKAGKLIWVSKKRIK